MPGQGARTGRVLSRVLGAEAQYQGRVLEHSTGAGWWVLGLGAGS